MWKKNQKAELKRRPSGSSSNSKSANTQKNLKLALIALLILGLLLLFGRVFQFFSEFQKPFYVLNTQRRSVAWDGNSVINLVIAKSEQNEGTSDLRDLSFVSFSPGEDKVTILKLSPDIYVDVPKNYGSWKLSSIYKLGQENNPPIGEDLVKMSVSKILALPVDGILEVSSKESPDIESLISEWKGNMFSKYSFLTKIKTDLSLKESLDFVSRISKVRDDNITSVDFLKTSITQSKLLPDSSRVLGVDAIKLDNFVKQNMTDPQISSEDLTVAVYNGTAHPGLTAEAVRMIENLGARVTIITNSSEKFVNSGIYINQEESEADVKVSGTYHRLTEIFAPNCFKQHCSTPDSEVLSSRAVINIVLGEDYYNYWSSR